MLPLAENALLSPKTAESPTGKSSVHTKLQQQPDTRVMGTRLLGSRFQALIPHSQPTAAHWDTLAPRNISSPSSSSPSAPFFQAAALPEQPLYDVSGAGGRAHVQ